MKVVDLADIDGIPVVGSLVWKPVRKTLGVTAFGVNAYVAERAGDDVVEEHTEEQLGHEEIYVVLTGAATFTVDGETFTAGAGTLVYLDDVTQRRQATATEAGTTVLAIGGTPGAHEVSPWELWFPAIPAIRAEDWDRARTQLEAALAERDVPAIHYQLACVEARAGNLERAVAELAAAIAGGERFKDYARDDEDLVTLREDPRWPALVG
jgi:hypothetical protein